MEGPSRGGNQVALVAESPQIPSSRAVHDARSMLRHLDRALLVEARTSDQVQLLGYLEKMGATQLDCAATFAEASVLARTCEYDVILADMTAPLSHAARFLRDMGEIAPRSLIIGLSTDHDDTVTYASMSHGADGFLEKGTLDFWKFRDGILRALSRRGGRDRRDEISRVAQRALTSVQSPSAVLDSSGRIIAVNDAWSDRARLVGARDGECGPGVNYLTTCDLAAGPFAEGAQGVARGIREVIDGSKSNYITDFQSVDPEQPRWFQIRATPLAVQGGGAIVTHLDITDIRVAELQVVAHEEMHHARPSVHDAERFPIFALLGADGRELFRSPMTMELLGLPADERPLTHFLGVVESADHQVAQDVFARVVATPWSSETVIIRMVDGWGRLRWLDLVVTNLLDDPAIGSIAITGREVTSTRINQISEHLQSRLLAGLPAAVVVTDTHGNVVYWNERAAQLYGYRDDEVLGRRIDELHVGPVWDEETSSRVADAGSWEGDFDALHADGSRVPIHVRMERVDAPELGFSGLVSTAIDIRDRFELERQLTHRERYDLLTDLPNRRRFVEHLSAALERRLHEAASVAILFVDIDDFKSINDHYGHDFGDSVLRNWSQRLNEELGPTQFAARIGGDEFLVCFEYDGSPQRVEELARRISQLTIVRADEGAILSISVSIGIAISTPDSTSEGLLRNADIALYSAKESGRACFRVFDNDLHQRAASRQELLGELARAIRDDSIRIYFQPVVSLRTGQIVGFETLSRWYHESRGWIPPDEFIPLAEEGGLIGDLTERGLREACVALKRWERQLPRGCLTVAVNFSAVLLLEEKWPTLIGNLCEELDVDASSLCLELTESSLIERSQAQRALTALKELGLEIALDDFGTGYSSLGRLAKLPVDFLKIDKSFVAGMGQRAEDDLIVTSILSLASSLTLTTVAEGVEQLDQWRTLRDLGCEYGQGFLWSPPVPLVEATALLNRGPWGLEPQ